MMLRGAPRQDTAKYDGDQKWPCMICRFTRPVNSARNRRAGYAGCRPKTVSTVLGPVQVMRAWYHCRDCQRGFAPRDDQLGVAGTSLSPGLAEMIARAGAEVPFGKAAALLADLAGVTVNVRTVERSAEASGAAARTAGAAGAAALRARTLRPLPPPGPVPDMLYVEVDGTGVPVRPGKDEDSTAGTREIKLAPFFTVSRLDDDGNPVMDPGSSTYVATFDGKDALAGLVEAEYLRRSGERFRKIVAIGDGAAWIWTMAAKLYPHATHIVDVWHAREHLTDLAAHLAFITPDPAQWLEDRGAELGAGNIQAIITAARQYPLAGAGQPAPPSQPGRAPPSDRHQDSDTPRPPQPPRSSPTKLSCTRHGGDPRGLS